MSDSSQFDPMAQFAQIQAWMSQWFNPMMRPGFMPTGLRYETVNPVVQEIAILAMMHNMASMIENPAAIKAAIDEALAERAERLKKK